jgi:hypothetical protein
VWRLSDEEKKVLKLFETRGSRKNGSRLRRRQNGEPEIKR